MNIQTRITYAIFVVLFLLGCNSVIPKEKEIYVFAAIDDSFVGDRDQILGVCNAFCRFEPQTDLMKFSVSDSEEKVVEVCDKIESALNEIGSASNAKCILISSGNYGVTLIKYLKAKRPKLKQVVTCYTTHQVTSKSVELIGVADFMAVPSHAIDEKFEKQIIHSSTDLISTIGVAHNTTEELILSDYERDREKITARSPYLVVVLGGDAPTSDGIMKYYTVEEAENLADFISKKAKSEKLGILILNGPRTGKFDQKTGIQKVGIHEENGELDDVTSAFVKRLENNNLKSGKDFNLFDFKFKQPSMKTVVYGALKKFGGVVFVAGESTSMVSEMTSLFDPRQVIIYKNKAMSENHLKHVHSEYENNRASMLNEDLSFNLVSDGKQAKLHESVATTIAKTILKAH